MRKVKNNPIKTIHTNNIKIITNSSLSLPQKITDANTKYTFIRNNFKEEIEELQDSFGLSFNFLELLDSQNDIIKVINI
jgi:hypothetical protein